MKFGTLFTVLSLFCICFTACDTFDEPGEKPGFIAIDSISFKVDDPTIQGSASSKITDAWVYVDNQQIGVFQLPGTIPYLGKGKHKVQVRAGIMDNGIAAIRSPYYFYTTYTQDITVNELAEIKINPQVQYVPNIQFRLQDDFESKFTLKKYSGDTIPFRDNLQVFEGYYSAALILDGKKTFAEFGTRDSFSMPPLGSVAYFELNYNTNTTLELGLYVAYSSLISKQPIIQLYDTKGQWKKIYINATKYLNSNSNALNFKVYFNLSHDSTSQQASRCYLDNIKILHL